MEKVQPNQFACFFGSVIAIVIFIIVWLIASLVINFIIVYLGGTYGEGPSRLGMLFGAGVSGYMAIIAATLSVEALIKAYWKKLVFWTFVAFLTTMTVLAAIGAWHEEKFFDIVLTLVMTGASGFAAFKALILEDLEI